MTVAAEKFRRMSLDELTTPKPGRLCYGPAWWTVTAEREVLFFMPGKRRDYGSPQCNSNEDCARYLHRSKEQEFPGSTVEFVPMAFIPHDCNDYV
jgi:hypothetical protein